MRNKTVAAVFAIFLGWLGIHCFYLGKKVRGIIYLLISVMSCIIGCICYLTAM
ncbi:TM2 domain-containing protein [uncultured Prevotella sp.]